MKNRIIQTALTITAGIIFLTCTNPFFPGFYGNTPNENNPDSRNSGPSTYIVTFHVGSNVVYADPPPSRSVDSVVIFHISEGAKIPKLPALLRSNYSFGGWYTNEACTSGNEWNFDTAVTSNIDLYAKWAPEPPAGIKVHFETNSGAPQPGDQNLAGGALVVEPPPVTKNGYAFDGWYKEANFINKWNFAADTVAADMTLYAKWVEVHYTVTFEPNGGTPEPKQQNSNGGKIVMPPPMTKPKSAFDGWYKEANFINKWNFTDDTVTGDITLFAKWIEFPIQYFTVTFNANGGEPNPVNQRIADGGKVNVPPADMKNGVNGFAGWYKEDTFDTLWDFTSDTVTQDIILYAKWSTPAFTVTFHGNGGLTLANDDIQEQTIAYGGKAIRPRPVFRYKFGFAGWYTEKTCTDGNEWDIDTRTVTGDIDLWAKWIPEPCTISYHPDGGNPPPHNEVVAGVGCKAVMPRPMNKDGYFFGGWYTEPDFINEWDFDTDTVDGDIDLYAKWLDIYYTVAFNGNGGVPAPDSQIVIHNGKILIPSPMSNGDSAFNGWYCEDTFSTQWDFAVNTVTDNITLFAKWVPKDHTVTFYADGGEPAPAQQHVIGSAYVAIPPPMTKAGYAFAGWYKETDFINAWNFNTDTVSGGDINLYAMWVVPPKYYTVTFNTNCSITAPVTQTIIEGGKITEPLGSAMIQEGYSFRGWYTENSVLWNFASDTVSGNMTLNAGWSIIYYTVIFNMGSIPDSNNQDIIFGGGDQTPENQSIAYGERIIEPLDMTRDSLAIVDGYGFDGWWLLDLGAPAEWKFEDNMAGPAYTTTGTTNINLYPRWIKDQKYLDYTDSYPRVDNGNLVWVRKGNFSMGSSKSVSSGYPVPRPVHQVTLTHGFFAGMYLITQQQYIKVMGYNPSSITTNSSNNPVNRVTWLDAIMFCNKLTDMENNEKGINLQKFYTIDESSIVYADGSKWPASSNQTIISAKVTINDWNANGYRLPTEAEWEYTARNGKGSPGDYDWSGSNTASEVAWYGGTGGTASDHTTHPVGLLKPNNLRTFDMSGNVCEWCWDELSSGYYTTSSPSITDPTGPGTNTVIINNPGQDAPRVRRGGSWNHAENNTRTFLRDSFQPTDSNMTNFWTIGFRVVRGPLQ